MTEESTATEVAEEAPDVDAVEASVSPTTPALMEPVSVWPFVAYVGLWAVFAGVVVWQLLLVPSDVAVFESRVYPLTIFVGMALTFAGPLLVVVSWVASLKEAVAGKGTLFVSALLKGGVSMFMGVSLWWLALVVVDQLRLGRIL